MSLDPHTLLRSISAYTPDFVASRILADPFAAQAMFEQRQRAVVLFADVSGFTAMSESLARLGNEGAEELTRVLNQYFTVMITLVEQYGGDVIKFGGDALTCCFPDGVEGVRSACACSLAMQKEMGQFQAVLTRGGVFDLRMKIGLSAGQVLFLCVGTPEDGFEPVLAGRPLVRMSDAEHHAAAGEVVIDGECLGLARSAMNLGEDRDGFFPVLDVAGGIRAGIPAPSPAGEKLSEAVPDQKLAQAIEQMILYLPPSVYSQILEGQRMFVGEHRSVTSLFVNFPGPDYDNDPAAGQKLQAYFTDMQKIIHRYGGRLNWLSTGDKGNVLHILFGAPVMHEDNEVRAVGCALAMLKEGNMARIGVATGAVFAGDVGSDRRRGYTVMGDVVNLSARLMQAAEEGEALIDRATSRRAEAEFVFEDLSPVIVKGKRAPVPVFRPIGERRETKAWDSTESHGHVHTSPLVGRDQELAQVDIILQRACQGYGQLVTICGDAGVGKSRFLEALIARAGKNGMTSLGGNCFSYGTQSPYLPWIDIFRVLFNLENQEGNRLELIEQALIAVDPALKDLAVLFAQLMGFSAPDNALTAGLDAQLRKQRVFDITLSLINHNAQQMPLLLVFEDVHWIDAISLELLNYVARNMMGDRMLLVAVHRPTIELPEWRRYSHYTPIELADLPAEDAVRLVALKLGLNEVPQALQACVLRGDDRVNAFFVEEIVNSLIDLGYLSMNSEGGYAINGDFSQVKIPGSVEALVMSRVDRLDESSKLTVKVASVIGRMFLYRTLQAIYPVEISPQRLLDNLDRLSRLDLTPLDRPAPDWEYIFKHVITQEVAYESLLYAHRRKLHQHVGEYLEQVYAGRLDEAIELLAHHFYRSGDVTKSWQYLVRAGDQACAQYANQAAIAHYTQALALGVDNEAVYRVYESLGNVYQLVGQFELAFGSYQKAIEHHPPSLAKTADLQRKIAMTWEQQGRYEEALQYLEQALSILVGEGILPEKAVIYGEIGGIAMRRGEYDEALMWCQKGLKIAEDLPDGEEARRTKDLIQHILATVYLQQGNYDLAINYFKTCIGFREQLRDLYRASETYNNLAVAYWGMTNYKLSSEYTQKSLGICQKIGDTYGTAMAYNNLGAIDFISGNYDQAIKYYQHSLNIRQRIGDLLGIADVYNNLGEVYHALGELTQSLNYLNQAVALLTELGDKSTLVDTNRLLAEVELEQGALEKALDYAMRSLELARELGNRESEGIANRVVGRVSRAAGRTAQAQQRLQASVDLLSEAGNRLELGRSCYELGLALVDIGQTEGARSYFIQAVDIFTELGEASELEKAQTALFA